MRKKEKNRMERKEEKAWRQRTDAKHRGKKEERIIYTNNSNNNINDKTTENRKKDVRLS